MPDFTHRFDWIPPSLKNRKRIERRGRNSALVNTPEVTEAIERIRAELLTVLGVGEGACEPLYGTDAIERELVWLVDERAVEVTWRSLGPDDRAGCGNRDLVNLAAVIDDAVGSIIRGPKRARVRLPGLVYVDDRQIARASERRVKG